MIEYELEAKQDPRKSFYGKATVEYDIKTGVFALSSYGTLVANYNRKENSMEVLGTHSATTLRHIKEFIFQMTEETGLTKAKIEDRFMKEETL